MRITSRDPLARRPLPDPEERRADQRDRQRRHQRDKFVVGHLCLAVTKVAPQLLASWRHPRRRSMTRILVAIIAAIVLAPLPVHAQERVGDAALGAVSGALVLGPVGAVAGAVVGFTAGP